MVRIEDSDSDNDDLVDRVVFERDLAVSNSFTSVISQLGIYGKATLQASFMVNCEANYYGSDCTTLCVPQDSNTLGHFVCNANGDRVCSSGYTGVDCLTRKSVVQFYFLLCRSWWNEFP